MIVPCQLTGVCYSRGVIRNLTPQQAFEIISMGEVDVIDVRKPHEWAAGHIDRSRLVPLAELRSSPRASISSDNVIFICAAGVRSETAARLAVGLGLKTVYNVSGGTRAWSRAGLPLIAEMPAAAAAG